MKNDEVRSVARRDERRPKGARQKLRDVREDLFASPVSIAELNHAYLDALREKGISLDDFRQQLGA
jgi:hypothetical protein